MVKAIPGSHGMAPPAMASSMTISGQIFRNRTTVRQMIAPAMVVAQKLLGRKGDSAFTKAMENREPRKAARNSSRPPPSTTAKKPPASPDQKISSRAGRGLRMVFSASMAMVSWKLLFQWGIWKLMALTSLMRVRSVPRSVTRYMRLAPSMVSSPIMIRDGVQKEAMVCMPPSWQIRSMVSSTR